MVVVAKGCQLLNTPSNARFQLPVKIVNLCVIHASHFVFHFVFHFSRVSAQDKTAWTFSLAVLEILSADQIQFTRKLFPGNFSSLSNAGFRLAPASAVELEEHWWISVKALPT